METERLGGEDVPLAQETTAETAPDSEALATAVTVGVVAVGTAIFEAALLPWVLLGAAAMLVPRHLPMLASAFTPLIDSTVRGTYKLAQKTKEMVAEAQEHVSDIVAEVDAEREAEAAEAERELSAPHAPRRAP